MSINLTHSYVRELETLILETLYPVYKSYYEDKGMDIPLVAHEIVQDVKRKTNLPALLKPKQNAT